MKTGYYTPEIEEIHIGTDCEVLDNSTNEWITVNIDKKLLLLIINNYDKVNDWLEKSVKIKYLDTEDIESLRLKITALYGDFIEFSISSNKRALYNILHKTLDLECIPSPNTVKTLFYGTIKNKSELIKILQQTNIL